jgi:hypothetical protein
LGRVFEAQHLRARDSRTIEDSYIGRRK